MCIIVYLDFSISLPAPSSPSTVVCFTARRVEIYIKTVALFKTLLFKNVILAFLCSALYVDIQNLSGNKKVNDF